MSSSLSVGPTGSTRHHSSVGDERDVQVIPPHSTGSSISNPQRRVLSLGPIYTEPPNPAALTIVEESATVFEEVEKDSEERQLRWGERFVVTSPQPSTESPDSNDRSTPSTGAFQESSSRSSGERNSGPHTNSGDRNSSSDKSNNGCGSDEKKMSPAEVEASNSNSSSGPQGNTSSKVSFSRSDALCSSTTPTQSRASQELANTANIVVVAAPQQQQQQTPLDAAPPAESRDSQLWGIHSSNVSNGLQTPNASNSCDDLSYLRRIVLHKDLVGNATYIPFTDFEAPPPLSIPRAELACLFIGQLPFNVSPEMIAWLVRVFAQRPVYDVIHDLKSLNTVSRGPVRLPSGCVRAFCRQEDKEHIINSLHEKILCDAEGVWVARTNDEVNSIQKYCSHLRAEPKDRARGFPYSVITVEPAKRPPLGGIPRHVCAPVVQ